VKSPEGRTNMTRFPYVTHHNPRVKKAKGLCFKHLTEGKCRPNCFNTHIPASKISAEVRLAVDKAFKKTYK
jgi:hypothetical protein